MSIVEAARLLLSRYTEYGNTGFGVFKCVCVCGGGGGTKLETYTANIFDVIFTVLKCVRLSTVISLYGLHLIAAPSTVE